MPLTGRVGRHATTGVNCQNWVADQMWVIGQLNLIPPSDGGSGGTLDGDHVKAGTASDPLYQAILNFQRKYYPAQVSGFVDPGGPVLARMDTLASRAGSSPSPPPAKTGPWGEFQSRSVQRALYEALTKDSQLRHAAVCDLLYATLEDGSLSTSEIADLKMVADASRTMTDRSAKMLRSFVDQATSNRRFGDFKLRTSDHVLAAWGVCDFMKGAGNGKWPHLDRDQVGVSLLMRVAYPRLIDTQNTSLCGPTAFMYQLMQDHPGSFVLYAVNVYERGTAHLRGMEISPRASLRQANPSGVDPADWLTVASIRDSEDYFRTYDSPDDQVAAITTAGELKDWFKGAGYTDVREDTNLTRHQRDTDNMDKASELFSNGYRVCLLIDAQMVKTGKQGESGSKIALDRHWIVLQSKIDRSAGNVKLTVYTWGEVYQVPKEGTLTLSDFLENYYGYVAAKP